MKVYFDKENLVSYISNKQSEDKTSFSREMLKRKCKILFTFPKDEVVDNEKVKMWLTTMSDGMRKDMSWNVNYPDRPLKANSLIKKGIDALQSVYLLNDDNVKEIQDKGIVLIGGIGEELNVLSSLWFVDMQYIKDIFEKVNKWDDILPYTSPTSDIIIIDNYLVHTEELIECNLIKILKTLCYYSSNQKLNIVLFVEKDDKRLRDYYENLKEKIEKVVKGKTSISPNVAIVAAPKSIIGEHDRTILTNYKMFVSGDSWNYFDSRNKKITKGRHLTVQSLVDDDVKKKADKLLEDMRQVFYMIIQDKRNYVYIKSTFKSIFLDYPKRNI